MIIIEDGKYFRICDDCQDRKEITKNTFNAYKRNKDEHFCSSCYQKGKRNHQYGIPSWNAGLTKETDERVAEYSKKDSLAKVGSEPWNYGKSYEELKGKEWAKNFREKMSKVRTGKKLENRRFSTKRNKSYKYFRNLVKASVYLEWGKEVLERDCFACRECGKRKELEVHHLRPFRKIIETVANKLLVDLNNYDKLSDKEFDLFVKEIVKEHKLEDRITYCKDCHKKFDKYRDKFDRKETNNESQIYAVSG